MKKFTIYSTFYSVRLVVIDKNIGREIGKICSIRKKDESEICFHLFDFVHPQGFEPWTP